MTSSMSFFVTLLALCVEVKGHGRLLEPPSRASMWRVGFDTPKNYNDNGLNCGGFWNQKSRGGKCGACGDPWQGPRDHEAGGKYATGAITRTYIQGQKISITVQITANHKGWFEFRVCPVNNKNIKVTQECLDHNVLRLADGSGTKYPIGSANGDYVVDVVLPSDMTCSQCVLQWKYHTGNGWGVDPDGRACTGCGPQEEFYGCSDISVIPNEDSQETTTNSVPKTTTVANSDTTTEVPSLPAPETTTVDSPDVDTCSISTVASSDIINNAWCTNNCGSRQCRKVLICV